MLRRVFVIKICGQLVAPRSTAMFCCGRQKYLVNWEIPALKSKYILRESSCTLAKTVKALLIFKISMNNDHDVNVSQAVTPLVLHLLNIINIISWPGGTHTFPVELYAAMHVVVMVLTAVCFLEVNCTELYLNKTSVDQLTVEQARYNHMCHFQIDSLWIVLNSACSNLWTLHIKLCYAILICEVDWNFTAINKLHLTEVQDSSQTFCDYSLQDNISKWQILVNFYKNVRCKSPRKRKAICFWGFAQGKYQILLFQVGLHLIFVVKLN